MALNKTKSKSIVKKPTPKVVPRSQGPKPSTNGHTNKSDVSAFLQLAKKADKAWSTASKVVAPPAPSFENLPRGIYIGKLKAAVVGVKEMALNGVKGKTRVPQVRFGFVVAEGDYEGTPVSRFVTLQNEKGWEFLSTDLQRLGCDSLPSSVEGIPTLLKELTEEAPTVKLSVSPNKKNPDFNNIYINGLVEAENAASDEDDDVETVEDENEENENESSDEDSDESEAPEIGMMVNHDDYGHCKITDVDETDEGWTLELETSKGSKVSGVDAAEVSIVEE